MNTLDTLYSRRSIRNYNNEKVSDDDIKEILKAANAAPVGMGKYEDVHLTVITSEKILDSIRQAGVAMTHNPDGNILYGAPLFIVVSAKLNGTNDNIAHSNAAIIDHNMAIACTELNLGCCHIWGGVTAINANPDILASLNIPEGFTPCCGLAIGHSDETYSLRDIPQRIATNVID
ncbi:MAG: nitroreductase family protein [Erysipelotrichaceae bacterium]|nr:nitroreductase family protein [Erysipelotrichaceae bacterium]MCD7839597.1 nitroreductase family protein [Erysipelotrichaceae bacterium]